jgi:hypothetical protein
MMKSLLVSPGREASSSKSVASLMPATTGTGWRRTRGTAVRGLISAAIQHYDKIPNDWRALHAAVLARI